jgi:hypothetical protein
MRLQGQGEEILDPGTTSPHPPTNRSTAAQFYGDELDGERGR